MKKILFSFGVCTTIVIPIATVISCGVEQNGKLAWNRSDKLLQFNLNAKDNTAPFKAYALKEEKFDSTEFINIVKDFENVISQNNIKPLDKGDIVVVEFMFEYKGGKENKNEKDLNTPNSKTKKRSVKFKFSFEKLSKESKNIMKKNPLGFRTNFAEALINGLISTELFKITKPIMNHSDLSKYFYKPDDSNQLKLELKNDDDMLKVIKKMESEEYKIPMATLPIV